MLSKSLYFLYSRKTVGALAFRNYQTSSPCAAGRKWRESQGLPGNVNAYGPLTDWPDYHFVADGRKAPPGSGKVRRVVEQRKWNERIMELSAEVDFAVERYDRIVKEEEDRRKGVLSSKLKPKGTVPSY